MSDNIITIDDVEYDIDDMNKEQKNLLNGINYADSKMKELQSQIGLLKEGMDSLLVKLKNSLND